MTWSIPTVEDVLEARQNIAPHLRPTPFYRYAGLSDLLGTETFVKHENHLPTGAFKVRGGVNLVSQLSADERQRGVICASTGNHGQSVAFASGIFGVRAIVCAPVNANPVKVCGHAWVRRGDDLQRCRFRRGPRALRGPRTPAWLPVHPLRRRAAPHCRSRHAHLEIMAGPAAISTSSSRRSVAAAAWPARASSPRRSSRVFA